MAIFTLIRSLSASFLPASAASAPSFRLSKSRIFSIHNKTAASGYRTLDRDLPNGGWPSAVLNEFLLSEPDIGALSLLKNALPQMLTEGKTLVLLVSAERNLHAKLNDWGINLKQIVLIETEHPAKHMATVEKIMRDENFGVLLCWLPEVRDDHLQRLHAAVSRSRGWAFLFRPLEQQNNPSPAMLRIVCHSVARTCISLRIIKRRGHVQGRPIILPLTLSALADNSPMRLPMSTSSLRKTTEIHKSSTPYHVDHRTLAAAAASHRAILHAQLHSHHKM